MIFNLKWDEFAKMIDKRIEHEEIDEFIDHLSASIKHTVSKLGNEYDSLTPDHFVNPEEIDLYKDHLSDRMEIAKSSKLLGDELAIIALYKSIEIKTKKIVHHKIPSSCSLNLSYFKQLHQAVPTITTLPNYDALNELRLINNSIKHGGTVSEELSSAFPAWVQDENITGLDTVYNRLLPLVKIYFSAFVDEVYSISAP